MRFLLLSQFFFPELISTGAFNTRLVRELVAQGHDVSVVCSHPVYPSWKPSRYGGDEGGYRVFRGGAFLAYPRSALLRRAVLELWFCFHVIYSVKRHGLSNADACLVVLPPELFVLPLRRLLGGRVPVVGLVHDLQGVFVESQGGARGFVAGLVRRLESLAMRRCDHLVFVSESMREFAQAQYGLRPNRVSVSLPFADEAIMGGDAGRPRGMQDKVVRIVYSGALGVKQNPWALLSAMQFVALNRPGWKVEVFSQGPVVNELRSSARFEAVSFYDLVPEERLPELLGRSTVQIVSQAHGTGHAALPSKLANIVAAEVKLLVLADSQSELAHLANQYPNGRVLADWSHSAILDVLDDLVAAHSVSRDGYRDLLDRFSLSKFGGQLVAICGSLTADSGAGLPRV